MKKLEFPSFYLKDLLIYPTIITYNNIININNNNMNYTL